MKAVGRKYADMSVSPEVLEIIQRAAQSMGLSLEVWNHPGKPSTRLNLASTCATCEATQPKVFDRCRKRRSYLTRHDAPVETRLAEKCAAKIRLARLAPDDRQQGPVLFAFGYDPPPEEEAVEDEKVLSFLDDLQKVMMPEARDTVSETEVGNVSLPTEMNLFSSVSGEIGREQEWNATRSRLLDDWRQSAGARLAILWQSGSSVFEVSGGVEDANAVESKNPKWTSTLQRLAADFKNNADQPVRDKLPAHHPLSKQFGGPAHLFAQALSVGGRFRGVVCGYSERPLQYDDVSRRLLTSLAGQLALTFAYVQVYGDIKSFLTNTVKTLVSAIDAKDAYTSGHSERVNIVSMLIGNELQLDLEDLEALYWGALLHDVGKIGMPESILNKPQDLDEAEIEIVKEHPQIGWEMLHNIDQLRRAADGVRYHHERWDGQGYPLALAGQDIPVIARIISVADTFDAIVSTRTYRKGRTPACALSIIEECSGSQFDPQVVAALRQLLPLLEKHQWVLMSGKKVSMNY